jgi:hypothetical protein
MVILWLFVIIKMESKKLYTVTFPLESGNYVKQVTSGLGWKLGRSTGSHLHFEEL